MLRPLYIRLQRIRLTMRIPQIILILIRLNRPQFISLLQILHKLYIKVPSSFLLVVSNTSLQKGSASSRPPGVYDTVPKVMYGFGCVETEARVME